MSIDPNTRFRGATRSSDVMRGNYISETDPADDSANIISPQQNWIQTDEIGNYVATHVRDFDDNWLVTHRKGDGGLLGSFTKANLPTDAPNGAVAKLLNKTRGLYRYGADLLHWVPSDAGNRINLLDFVNPLLTPDCTEAIQDAFDFLAESGGGTIVCPAGYTFYFNQPIIGDGKYNVTFEGTNTNKHSISGANLIYTGSGTATAMSFARTVGIVLRNMNIRYNNAAFTGDLIAFGHNGIVADAQDMKIVGCSLGGYPEAKNAANILNLNLSILGEVSGNGFSYANVGLRGTPEDEATYSNVFSVINNVFDHCVHQIRNPGNNWNIQSNGFEPLSLEPDGYNINNCVTVSDGSDVIRGLSIINNYIGDASQGNISAAFVLKGVLGGVIQSNWGSVPYNGTFCELINCQGAIIEANRIETQEVPDGQPTGTEPNSLGLLINNGAGLNYGVVIVANSFNCNRTYMETGGDTIGLFVMPNENAGGLTPAKITNGFTIQGSPGSDKIGGPTSAIGFGTVTDANPYAGQSGRLGGGIRMSNNVPGVTDGRIILSTREDAVTGFEFWNGLKLLLLTFEGAVFYRPVSVPTVAIGSSGADAASTAFVQNEFGSKILSGSADLDFPSIAAGNKQDLTLAVSGAAVGDVVNVSPSGGLETGIFPFAFVSAANTVTIRLTNATGSAIDPAARTFKIKVFKN